MVDPARVNECTHEFCFACILQWSKVSSTCPLCKTPFQALWNVTSRTSVPVEPAAASCPWDAPANSSIETSLQDELTHGYDMDDGFVVPDGFVEFEDMELMELVPSATAHWTGTARLRSRRERRRRGETASDAISIMRPPRSHRRVIVDDEDECIDGATGEGATRSEKLPLNRRSKYFGGQVRP
ncbi:hypothetical protein H257_06818 [Aphanomyces astaci]|uniref:RING-type E3 ubiquitin transferase n=1 Tax=Aphanomyces astaci TaxID=112090 RepID=W4GKZ8_APHAT|nr:hypothetical protein H257_06818 [Aphanomyces astaci]ETV79553.1 hypothetical protein H257_06818 [Aphanomyces astaci]|eukprot:XP_009830489.1 hypothetical protein H257_06818 [Aphanomyces astaci]